MARRSRSSIRRRTNFSFAFNADTVVRRSTFKVSPTVYTTFNAGFIVPLKYWEVLPGDTYQINLRQLTRLWTPIVPFMDNLRLKIYYFFVPNRLVWDNWEKFLGDHGTPDEEVATNYIVPTLSGTVDNSYTQSIFDCYGFPIVPASDKDGSLKYGNDLPVNAMICRGYNLIYNEWFRRQFIITDEEMAVVETGDGPDDISIYTLRRRAKRLDYFTGCNPWPQAGPQVTLPIGGEAPVIGNGNALGLTNGVSDFGLGTEAYGSDKGALLSISSSAVNQSAGSSFAYSTNLGNKVIGVSTNPLNSGLIADTSGITGINVNDIRQLVQIQRFYEKLARGGARYTEIIRSFFGVDVGDARLQRPEYLGGGEVMLYVNPVAQTSATDSVTPQGNLAAFAVAHGRSGGFIRSFTEHGFIHCFAVAYTDQTYQQGMDRALSRQHWTDYYWPTFAHLGEQAVLNKELYCDGTADDNVVFGYQERYAEYRYDSSRICGFFRSNSKYPLDMWHLAQYWAERPTLSADFIEENPPIKRVVQISDAEEENTPQFFGMFVFNVRATRPMPTYGTPGMVDHF